MAFEADVIALNAPVSYNDVSKIFPSLDMALREYSLCIEKQVDITEYEESTCSKEINKYIRVPIEGSQEEIAKTKYEMILVGKEKYKSFDQFSSSRYFTVSMSHVIIQQLGTENLYTVIRCRFHPNLYNFCPEFETFLKVFGMLLSSRYPSVEISTFRAVSTSRSSDDYSLFIGGKEKDTSKGKAALTDVKNQYHIDINDLMSNVDSNIGLYYSPLDYGEVCRQLQVYKKNLADFMSKVEEEEAKEGKAPEEVGGISVELFKSQNNQMILYYEERKTMLAHALKAEPFGNMFFFKLDSLRNIQTTSSDSTSDNERLFGREVKI